MTSQKAAANHVSAREMGSLLRLAIPGRYVGEVASDLLGFMQSELDGEAPAAPEDSGRQPGVCVPVPIHFDGLTVELSTEGGEIELRRIGGSGDEFDELCELVVEEWVRE